MKLIKNLIIIVVVIGGSIIAYQSFFGSDKTGKASPEICEIVNEPRKYSRYKQVTVQGKVRSSKSLFGINVFKLGQLNDTCSIRVVSQGASPQKGEEMTIKGDVREAYKIGDNRMLVIVED